MLLNEMWRRVRFWLKREDHTRELEEEMRVHVELRAESLRRMRTDPDATFEATAHHLRITNDPAYAAARKRFGNTTALQQRSRDMWGFGRVEDLSNDVRFALRRLAQRPAFTAAVIGVMAIGIGATTAMFSAVDAALLRPLPFDRPDQLVWLPGLSIPRLDPGVNLYGRGYEIGDAVEMKTTFSEVAAYGAGALDLNHAENPMHVSVGIVSANFFRLLGTQPIKGRVFVNGESSPPAPRVVVLSYGLWQRAFGGREIAGLKIMLSEYAYDVIGVMPPGFSFPKQSDLWIPLSIPYIAETQFPFSDGFQIAIAARLVDGVTVSQAATRVMTRWKQLRGSRLVDTSKADFVYDYMVEQGAATTLQQKLVGDRRTALLVLLGATGLLLLVACVNVTNLLLAHSAARAREIAVRQVLGATRSRIVRQLLTESVVLALGGALLGVLLAPLAFGLLTVMMPKALIGVAPAHIDLRILAFAASLALVTGIAFGMWPALGSVRRDGSEVIKSGGGHGSTAARGGRVRRILVGAELALTTALLIGAGLMLQSFRQLMARETGMETDQVATLKFTFPRSAAGDEVRLPRAQDILQRLSAMPDIAAAGFVTELPLGGDMTATLRVRVPGAPVINSSDMDAKYIRRIRVTSGYFNAMSLELVRGRLFTEADETSGTRVAVIGERFAKTYWPDREVLGGVFFSSTRDSVPTIVIGVVADVREEKLESVPLMQAYIPMNAGIPRTMSLVVRSALPEQALLARMTAVVRSVDKTQAVFNVRMMNDVRDISVAPRRTNALLINTFALLALALASVGIYAVVSYGVSHRSRELGIRSALGATGSNLVKMISREMIGVVLAGVSVGLIAAWALARTLESLVFGIDVHDLRTFVVVPLALLIPVAAATLIPARKVLSVDPALVLRAD